MSRVKLHRRLLLGTAGAVGLAGCATAVADPGDGPRAGFAAAPTTTAKSSTPAAAAPATSADAGVITGASDVTSTAGPAATNEPLFVVDIGATGPGIENVGIPLPAEEALTAFGMTSMPIAAGSTAIDNRIDVSAPITESNPRYRVTETMFATAATPQTKEDVIAKFKEAVSAVGSYNFTESTQTGDDGTQYVTFQTSPVDPAAELASFDVAVGTLNDLPGVITLDITVNHEVELAAFPPLVPASVSLLRPAADIGESMGWTLTGFSYNSGFNPFGGDATEGGSLNWSAGPGSVTDVAPIADEIVAVVGVPDSSDADDDRVTNIYADGSSWSVSYQDYDPETALQVSYRGSRIVEPGAVAPGATATSATPADPATTAPPGTTAPPATPATPATTAPPGTTATPAPPATTAAGATTVAGGDAPVATPLAVIDIGATGPGLEGVGSAIPAEQAVTDYAMTSMPIAAGSTAAEASVTVTAPLSESVPEYTVIETILATAATPQTKEEVIAKFKEAVSAVGAYNFTESTQTGDDGSAVSIFRTDEQNPEEDLPEFTVQVSGVTDLPGVLAIEVEVIHRPTLPSFPAIPAAAVEYFTAPMQFAATQPNWRLTEFTYSSGINIFDGSPTERGSLVWSAGPGSTTDVATIAQTIVDAMGVPETSDVDDDRVTNVFADESTWTVSYQDFDEENALRVNWRLTTLA